MISLRYLQYKSKRKTFYFGRLRREQTLQISFLKSLVNPFFKEKLFKLVF